jgi:hypothetical protein
VTPGAPFRLTLVVLARSEDVICIVAFGIVVSVHLHKMRSAVECVGKCLHVWGHGMRGGEAARRTHVKVHTNLNPRDRSISAEQLEGKYHDRKRGGTKSMDVILEVPGLK